MHLLVADLPGSLRCAFTTRFRTGDDGRLCDFDLSRTPDDPPSPSSPDRSALGEALAALDGAAGDGPRLVSPQQVHGVRVVGTAEYVRAGASSGCDGLTVALPLDDGLAALLLFADCVPIVLIGEVDAAVVHAGWRGLVGGVAQQGARAMTGPPAAAVIGPSIGPCCFAVGDEVAEAFAGRYGAEVVLPGPRVDLWTAAVRAVGEVGVSPARVTNPRLCTMCNNDLFYSYRAEGPSAGRHGAVLWAAGPVAPTR